VATTTHPALPARASSPIARWHLLSLDAPTVAALWTWFIARACHIMLPLAAPLAMALAVWMLYAADRLLDARNLDAPNAGPVNELEARHLFHHRHRCGFLVGIALAAVSLAALVPRLNAAAMRLYLVEGVLLVAWFLVLHATRSAHRLPKEIAVGLFFSAAVFIPTVAREPFANALSLRLAMLPSAVLFAALCSLNCLFIYAWEHTGPSHATAQPPPASARPPHASTRLALDHLPSLAAVIALAGAALALFNAASPRLIPAACALAAMLLLALDRQRRRLSRTDLRAAADLALLTPLLLLRFLR
jgi:hypothetical protein